MQLQITVTGEYITAAAGGAAGPSFQVYAGISLQTAESFTTSYKADEQNTLHLLETVG